MLAMSETVNKDEKRSKVDFESSDVEKVVQIEDDKNGSNPAPGELSFRFFERFILQGLNVDLIDHGRLICSIKVPPRLLNAGNFLHGGATATLVDMVGSAAVFTVGGFMKRVSVDINVSYFDAAYAGEEIEIEAKVLSFGKVVAVASVEFRKKITGKVIAQGRHTMFLSVPSNL